MRKSKADINIIAENIMTLLHSGKPSAATTKASP